RVTWGNMGSRFLRWRLSTNFVSGRLRYVNRLPAPILCLLLLSLSPPLASAQFLLKPAQPGELVTLMPSDMAILESPEARKDLPCTITERKPDLGFDLRFHTGYDVTVPMKELAGSGEMLTVVLRIYPQDVPAHPTYLVQHVGVPPISEDVKGDAILQGTFDLGEGKYHIDWLMRDRAERTCSSKWDTEAALAPKDKPISLLLGPNAISETPEEPFVNDTYPRHASDSEGVNLKVLVNFAPQNPESPQLQRSDTDALVSIVKAIERDPHVNRVSLIAFNMEEGRVVYRQETGDYIDFPSLGKAVRTMKLGTVNLLRLGQKHSDTDFLQNLIANEVGTASHPDAIVFAG